MTIPTDFLAQFDTPACILALWPKRPADIACKILEAQTAGWLVPDVPVQRPHQVWSATWVLTDAGRKAAGIWKEPVVVTKSLFGDE